MQFKFFTKKTFDRSIAVNKDNVIFVEDTPNGTCITMSDGNYFEVTENYLQVVARLNERD